MSWGALPENNNAAKFFSFGKWFFFYMYIYIKLKGIQNGKY
jgi:hypothetical protein